MFIKIDGTYISIDDISRVIIKQDSVKAITEEWCRFNNITDIRDDLHYRHGINIRVVTFEVRLKSDNDIKYIEQLYFDNEKSSERNLYNKDFSLIMNYKSNIAQIEKLIKLVDNDIDLSDFGRII